MERFFFSLLRRNRGFEDSKEGRGGRVGPGVIELLVVTDLVDAGSDGESGRAERVSARDKSVKSPKVVGRKCMTCFDLEVRPRRAGRYEVSGRERREDLCSLSLVLWSIRETDGEHIGAALSTARCSPCCSIGREGR